MAAGRRFRYISDVVFSFSSIFKSPRSNPQWRSLCQLASPAEAALVSARCKYSLSTVEVMCNAAATYCALTEQEHLRNWRWAVYGVDDIARAEGSAPTHSQARRAALKALVILDRQGVVKLPARSHSVPPLAGAATA
ncbi:MAG: hypothetical protein JWQ83_2220 [Lacunisphaera sp.]|nr:hypothetical protein [Lacunisphaera sp.]MDB6167080.1 hypothetical protein [Lacunisphaera sp.]